MGGWCCRCLYLAEYVMRQASLGVGGNMAVSLMMVLKEQKSVAVQAEQYVVVVGGNPCPLDHGSFFKTVFVTFVMSLETIVYFFGQGLLL